MGMDLWFRDDVARILASTAAAMQATQAATPALDDERAAAYRVGFDAALEAVALAFGLPAAGNGGRPDVVIYTDRRLIGGR